HPEFVRRAAQRRPLFFAPYLLHTKLKRLFLFRRAHPTPYAEFTLANRVSSRRGVSVKKPLIAATAVLYAAAFFTLASAPTSDEASRLLGLQKAWNTAIELKRTKSLDQLLAPTFDPVEIDGSVSSKSEFLASIKAPEYQPSQAVNEDMSVQVYGNYAVVVGIFRIKGMEKGKPYVHRERFVDTWIRRDGGRQPVARPATLIYAK